MYWFTSALLSSAVTSQATADYLVKWLLGAKREHGLDIDTIGIWNETKMDYAFIKTLKRTLTASGLKTRIIDGRMTSTMLWCLVTAYYDILDIPYAGLLRADTPWSGHYELKSPLWVVAHTSQFAKPAGITSTPLSTYREEEAARRSSMTAITA